MNKLVLQEKILYWGLCWPRFGLWERRGKLSGLGWTGKVKFNLSKIKSNQSSYGLESDK